MSSDFAVIYITCANADEAQRIGAQLVTERLAGCANIIPAVQSIYWWEGQVTRSEEAIIIAKTMAAKIHDLNERVRSLHSYTTPAIIAVPLLHMGADFAKWLEENLEGS
jgi:periplasmic divalent cation tolerance protein